MNSVTNNTIYQTTNFPIENVQKSQSAATDPVENSPPANSGRYSILNALAKIGSGTLIHCAVAAVGYAIFGALGFGLLGPLVAVGSAGCAFLAGAAACNQKAKNADSDEQKKTWQQRMEMCTSIAVNLLTGMAIYTGHLFVWSTLGNFVMGASGRVMEPLTAEGCAAIVGSTNFMSTIPAAAYVLDPDSNRPSV